MGKVRMKGEITMTINYKGCRYTFRACDCQGITHEDLERIAQEQNPGKQYDPHNGNTYIYIKGIGYGMAEYYVYVD